MSLRESWAQIAGLFCDRAFGMEYSFPLGVSASRKQIRALEKVIGYSLPEDVRESYLLHNGAGALLDDGEVMSLERIESTWKMYNQAYQDDGPSLLPARIARHIEGPIKPIFWNPLRVQMTDSGGGIMAMIDLDPDEGDTRGQVISFDHEIGPERVLAQSWSEWLKKFADDIEARRRVS